MSRLFRFFIVDKGFSYGEKSQRGLNTKVRREWI